MSSKGAGEIATLISLPMSDRAPLAEYYLRQLFIGRTLTFMQVLEQAEKEMVSIMNTINGEAVMRQVRQGTVPPYWHVFPAKVSQFLKNIAVYTVFTLLLLGCFLYLRVHPEFVIGLRGSAETPELHALWRMIDFIAVGLATLPLLFFLLREVWNLGTAHQQALVLLPEGFVMQKGATRRSMTVIHYGAISEITTSVSDYTWFLVMPRADGYGIIKLALDGRFGPSSEISDILEQAHQHYAMVRAGY